MVMTIIKRTLRTWGFASIVGLAAIPSTGIAEITPLEWSADISPGLSEAALTERLENLGSAFAKRAGGLTYTSMISTGGRDYLFCEDQLYAVIEGAFVTGREFNDWFQEFLSAHDRYGEPRKYEALEDWGRFRAEWDVGDGSTLHFQLQSDLEAQQGWSRQLYADDVGKPCM
jgi:hypothetical protein